MTMTMAITLITTVVKWKVSTKDHFGDDNEKYSENHDERDNDDNDSDTDTDIDNDGKIIMVMSNGMILSSISASLSESYGHYCFLWSAWLPLLLLSWSLILSYFIIKASSLSPLPIQYPISSWSLSPSSFQYYSVRPSLFTMEATPMPVEVNTSITGTCRANEIRPQPEEFYWRLGDTHIQGLRSTDSVNSTYPVFRVSSTFSHVAIADDNGKNLTCILVMQNGEDLRRRVRISIIGVGSPAGEKGADIFSLSWCYSITRFGETIMHHCEVLAQLQMNDTCNTGPCVMDD